MYRVGFKKITPGKIQFVFSAKHTKVQRVEPRMAGLVDTGIGGSFAGMPDINLSGIFNFMKDNYLQKLFALSEHVRQHPDGVF